MRQYVNPTVVGASVKESVIGYWLLVAQTASSAVPRAVEPALRAVTGLLVVRGNDGAGSSQWSVGGRRERVNMDRPICVVQRVSAFSGFQVFSVSVFDSRPWTFDLRLVPSLLERDVVLNVPIFPKFGLTEDGDPLRKKAPSGGWTNDHRRWHNTCETD